MIANRLIKDLAEEAGIKMCGVTDYKVEKSKLEYLKLRKNLGRTTEFEEEDLRLRLDKTRVLEGARSIIVIAVSYNTDREEFSIYPRGNLSKVSFGEDYHQVVMDRVKDLVRLMEEKLDFTYKAFVDTGPLIDRELAYLSGIGYYGKNCSIINEDYGSFIAIGYIVTDLEIENDQALNLDCGTCSLCLDACPTKALEGEYRLNPKKCISYLTQVKDVAEELRDKMGVKVYGCDTCQLVCPKNIGVKKSQEPRFKPIKTKGYIDILELLTMTNKEFKEKYGTMSGSWRGKNILKRNSIIALRNLGDRDFIGLIEEETKSKSPLVKEYASWALKELKGG